MSSLVSKSDLSRQQVSKAPRNRSKFDMSAHHLTTLQFGRVLPFFNLEAVNGDKITLRSSHSLQTFTLKSPVLSNIRMRKDYFSVPMESILPNNWQKIFTNPMFGDDVDATLVNCVMPLNSGKWHYGFPGYKSSQPAANGNMAANSMNNLSILEMIFSRGSLLARMGYDLSGAIQVITDNGAGEVYDGIDKVVEAVYDAFPIGPDVVYKITYTHLKLNSSDPANSITFVNVDSKSKIREIHDFILEHGCINIFYTDPSKGITDAELFTSASGVTYPLSSQPKCIVDFANLSDGGLAINLAPIAAYQIAVAHYLTNDKVDDIYSADLYRQMMLYLGMNDNKNASGTFKFNDVTTYYDALSGFYIQKALQNGLGNLEYNAPLYKNPGDYSWFAYTYLANLLLPRRSLRYVDYFTGAKTRPLALGDTSVELTAESSVDVVDVTKGLQMQRFLNFVNRTGRKFEEYVGKLNGTFVKPDYHNPSFLGSTLESLYNPKVENTGAKQFELPNSVTSTIAGDSNKFAFSFDCDRPSIVLGLVSFDLVRCYSNCIDRNAFHINRFDYFNPFLQHIGDQPILAAEYYFDGYDSSKETSLFGYQTRHSEYKQKVSRADGGFTDGSLPSWCFLNKDPRTLLKYANNIGSEAIRSIPQELDEFYLSLPYVNNSSYFHFIVDFFNDCKASRPMIATPNIL